MSKRNLTTEIKALKERGVFDNGIFHSSSLDHIDKLLDKSKECQSVEFDEFYKYLPIACVTAMESFSRTTIKSLIDKGGDYFDNLSGLIPTLSIKIDFEILSSLQKQQFTLGEFISHLLPCNNLNDVNKNLSIILGFDFLEKIREFKDESSLHYGEDDFNKLNKGFGNIISSVKRIFELRHIYCHEPLGVDSIDRSELAAHYDNFKFFLNYCSNYACSLIYDDWGIATCDKVDIVASKVPPKEAALIEFLEDYKKRNLEISEDPDEFRKIFQQMVDSWNAFSHAKGNLKSSYTSSGYWASIIYNEERMNDIDQFIKSFQ